MLDEVAAYSSKKGKQSSSNSLIPASFEDDTTDIPGERGSDGVRNSNDSDSSFRDFVALET